MLSMLSYFNLFFAEQSISSWTLFTNLWHSLLKRIIPLLLFQLPRQLVALWPYFHSSCTYPWRTQSCCSLFMHCLIIQPCLLVHFLFLTFTKLCIPEPRDLFLEVIGDHLGDIHVTGYVHRLYYSGNTPKTCAFI